MKVSSGTNNTISAPRLKNKSNSGERARSKKKNGAKDTAHQRPKTSKSQRKEKQLHLNKVIFIQKDVLEPQEEEKCEQHN